MSDFEKLHPRLATGQFAAKTNTAPVAELIHAVPEQTDYAVAQEPGTWGQRYAAAGVAAAAGWAGVTPRDREVFTTADCMVLANALHTRTGWRIVGVGDGPDGVIGSLHAGVVTPGGLIVDVEGLHEPADWVDRWGAYVDSYGRDELEYDSESVWVYDAAAFGWEGPGTRFGPQEPPASMARADAVAGLIMTSWNGRW